MTRAAGTVFIVDDAREIRMALTRLLELAGYEVLPINSMLLRAMVRLAPRDINVSIFNGLGELQLFNPDLEASLPANVVTFHRVVADADALLFASPEYAHGVTGTIKNALDWLVGFEPFASKFVAVLECGTASAPRRRCLTRNTQNHGGCDCRVGIDLHPVARGRS